jgi:hypothetical protein
VTETAGGGATFVLTLPAGPDRPPRDTDPDAPARATAIASRAG